MNVQHLTIERDSSQGMSRITFLIQNTLTGRFIRMGASETRYLLESIMENEASGTLGVAETPELNEDLKAILKGKFEEWGFLSAEAKPKRAEAHEAVKKIVLCRFNVEKMLKAVYPIYSKFFSIPGLIALIFLAAFDIAFLAYNAMQMNAAGMNIGTVSIVYGWQDVLIVLAFVIITTFFHEFAHAVNCKKYGGTVKNMGILLYYCIPCFFCDVSSVYTFKDKRQRAMVAGSGVLANLFIGLLLIFISLLLAMRGIIFLGLVYSGIAVICVAVYNLIPFVKLDGYWLLSSACGVTNLMEKAVIVAYTAIFRRDRLSDIGLSPAKKVLMFLYGVTAFVFSEVFWVSTLLSLGRLFSAWSFIYYPIVLIVIALITWDFVKTIMHYRKLIKNDYDRILRTI